MGTYLNPGNSGFAEILKTDYVDKTGLISLINSTIETKKKLTCISRPRRFGKSYAAQMLCAYYDKTCDSHALFADYAIAGEKSYGNYINQYDVIYWDMTGIKPYTGNYKNLVPFLIRSLTDEIAAQYPKVIVKEDLSATLVNTVENAGNKIVIIIDEWDAPIRENPGIQAECCATALLSDFRFGYLFELVSFVVDDVKDIYALRRLIDTKVYVEIFRVDLAEPA